VALKGGDEESEGDEGQVEEEEVGAAEEIEGESVDGFGDVEGEGFWEDLLEGVHKGFYGPKDRASLHVELDADEELELEARVIVLVEVHDVPQLVLARKLVPELYHAAQVDVLELERNVYGQEGLLLGVAALQRVGQVVPPEELHCALDYLVDQVGLGGL
jgi:hypothetical protein